MCQTRWEKGAQEYGDFKFLENDTIEMLLEEIADWANYARMTYIKVYLLGVALSQKASGTELDTTEGFVPMSKIYGKPKGTTRA